MFNAPLSVRWRARAARIVERDRRRMRVFTCSWSDFFDEHADGWRDAAWDVIRRCPEYDWQILTKRVQRIARCLPADWGDGWRHAWLGVSIESRRFVHRADALRDTPAAVRFISAEPLLGALDGLELAPGHRAEHPSCQVGGPHPECWHCMSCGASGGIYDLASLMLGGPYGRGRFAALASSAWRTGASCRWPPMSCSLVVIRWRRR
jgi:hypothetical protein